MKRCKRWAVVAALAMAGSAANAATWNGSEYQVVTGEGITWTGAQSATTLMGSGWHLATITSADEHAFVSALLPSSPASRSHYWLGASDAANEGIWQWVTGEPWSYTHWWGGEPNNSGGTENFLAYDFYSGAGWGWNDAADDMHRVYGFIRGYVIERAVVSAVPLPGSLALLGAGFAVAGWAARRKRAR